MALDRILTDGSETGLTVANKVNDSMDEIEKRASQYDATMTYEKGEIVTDSNGKIRISNTTIITPEPFDDAKWDSVSEVKGATQEAGYPEYVPDFGINRYFEYRLNQDSTIQTPVNVSVGDEGTILVKQDFMGGWNCTFASEFVFPTGAPTLNTDPNAYNVFKFTALATSKILMEFVADLV